MTDVHITGVEEDEIDTVLAEDVSFSGTLRFVKPLMIKGRFSGTIHSKGDLYVSEAAVVEAEVHARMGSIKGSVRGDVEASHRVELFAKSSLEGDIVSPEVVMEAGSVFNGASKMKRQTVE
jgi:cytoskeletal protein CcmA (bactofilin family)